MAGKPGRIAAALIILAVFGMPLVAFLRHDFVPTPATTAYGALVALLPWAMVLGYLRRRRGPDWLGQVVAPGARFQRFKRWCMPPLVLAYFYVMFYIGVVFTLAESYTDVVGTPQRVAMSLERNEGGRFGCGHRLQVADRALVFAYVCIDGGLYARLPRTPVTALLQVKRSGLGDIIDGVRLPRRFYDAP